MLTWRRIDDYGAETGSPSLAKFNNERDNPHLTVHGLWGRRLKRVRQAPGRKILVYGNHEITGAGLVDSDGFDEVHSTLYVDGDPPLLLTHVPLRVFPEGCVNVHDHLHQVRVQGRTRHINVCVEQVHYRPRPLTAIRRLAGCLVRGERVPGRTTAQQRTPVGRRRHRDWGAVA